jgi:HPt (histidine-containing phosphotransfer) domain-containing protein
MTKSRENTVVVNDPFARRLMVRYLDHRQDDVESLRAALARQDYESIRKKGHNLFGSGSAYGLDRVSELGASLEKTAKRGNSDAIGDLIEALDAFIRNVRVV